MKAVGEDVSCLIIVLTGSKCVQPYERIPFHLFLGRVQ
uniref:Uncharacterized protein n=1 Tax=Solanum lycopersicum TaxID=4081 RepID=K4C2U3_SOLLC